MHRGRGCIQKMLHTRLLRCVFSWSSQTDDAMNQIEALHLAVRYWRQKEMGTAYKRWDWVICGEITLRYEGLRGRAALRSWRRKAGQIKRVKVACRKALISFKWGIKSRAWNRLRTITLSSARVAEGVEEGLRSWVTESILGTLLTPLTQATLTLTLTLT